MPEAAPASRFVVIARGGLKLRSGPSQDFDALRTVPEGTIVNVLSRESLWALAGGSHGFPQFKDTFDKGMTILPH